MYKGGVILPIPLNITRHDVLSAIEKIDNEGIRDGRHSNKYSLRYQGKLYPPKYVITLANIWANGEELSFHEFISIEANRFLRNMGFEIIEKSTK